MNAVEFAQLLQILAGIKHEMQRMADAAEAQVEETKAMRAMVKTAALKARQEDSE